MEPVVTFAAKRSLEFSASFIFESFETPETDRANVALTISRSSITISSQHGLETLPAEVLFTIIHFMPLHSRLELSLTCRPLNRIVLDPSLWRTINLSVYPRFRSLTRLMELLKKEILPIVGKEVRTINLQNHSENVDFSFAQHIATFCKNLVSINLKSCENATETGIFAVVESCKKIKYLSLANLKFLNDRILFNIASSLTLLQSLDISCNFTTSNINDKSIVEITKCCNQLRGLFLMGCSAISDMAFGAIGCCPHLQRLDLQGCFRLTDQGAMHILRSCPNLTHIDFSYCWRLTDDALKEIGWDSIGCSLRHVNLQFCYQLSDDSISSLLRVPSIYFINASHCQSMTLNAAVMVREKRPEIVIYFFGCGIGEIGNDKIIETDLRSGKFLFE